MFWNMQSVPDAERNKSQAKLSGNSLDGFLRLQVRSKKLKQEIEPNHRSKMTLKSAEV